MLVLISITAWISALSFELGYEVRPGENTVPPVRTEILLTFDERQLYVAFRAFDPDPSSIRARYSDRDRTWEDVESLRQLADETEREELSAAELAARLRELADRRQGLVE